LDWCAWEDGGDGGPRRKLVQTYSFQIIYKKGGMWRERTFVTAPQNH